MPLAEISAYNLSLFVHITAVVVGFGSTFAEALMFPVATKLSPRHLPYVHRLQLAINQYFASPALGARAAAERPTRSTAVRRGESARRR